MKKTLAAPPRPRARGTTRRRMAGLAALGLLVPAALLSLWLAPRAKSSGGPVAVQVANTPLPASDIDGGARQPVAVTVGVSVSPGAGYAITNYTVPAHQRLVVRSVNSELSNSDTTFPPVNITLVAQTAGATDILYIPFNTGVGTLYVCNQPTALVADAGSTVQVEVSLSSAVPADGYSACRVTLLGYLEPAS